MLVAEEELAVEVAEVDGVEVDNVDLAEAGEDEVLEQFAADAASSYHQDARLDCVSNWAMACLRVVAATSLMR
jgi:predicted PilT family ATPase